MELSKVLLGAILVGITAGGASCTKGGDYEVKPKKQVDTLPTGEGEEANPEACFACGMG